MENIYKFLIYIRKCENVKTMLINGLTMRDSAFSHCVQTCENVKMKGKADYGSK